jgi:hypothetical protein
LDAVNPKSYPGSGTTWNDLSTNRNTVTFGSSPNYNSSNGSFSFASSNYGTISNLTNFVYGSNPRTITCWMYVNSITSGSYYWGWSYGSANSNQAMFLGTNNNTFYFGGYGNDVTSNGVPLLTWFNMTGTYDGTTAILYVNGIEVNRAAKSWNTTQNVGYIANQVNGFEILNGGISICSLYNRVLTAQEVLQNYNAHRGRYGL